MTRRLTTIAVLAACITIPVPMRATGVVAFRTPGRVVLGADEALTTLGASGEVVGMSMGCKLGRTSGPGRWTFTWGGLVAGGTDVNLIETFRAAIAPADTLADLVRTVRTFIQRHILTVDWNRLRHVYDQPDQVLLWVGIGRVRDGVPELAIVQAMVARREPLGLDVVSLMCPGNCAADWLAGGIAAERGPIAERLAGARADYPDWLRRLDGAAAFRLLGAQADATPSRVRRPLDVLELTVNGARWIHRAPDSACPAVLGRVK